jgi:hypothetical protein
MPRETAVRTSLSTENDYLKYLIEVAVPSKIKKAYRLENLSQLMIMALSTLAVFLGFSAGKLRHH